MKKLKQFLPIAILALGSMNANAAFVVKKSNVQPTTEQVNQNATSLTAQANASVSELANVNAADNAAATTEMKKSSTDISKGLYIILAILGLGWLAMGLLDDFSGSDWIISLILYCIFWFPGFIYSLIKMKKYYK